MSRYFTALLSLVLCPVLLAAGDRACTDPEPLLRRTPNSVTQLTDCLLECTGMTYIRKIRLQDRLNVQFQDSTEGDLGEYCWSTALRCTVGERFHRAYVVLPVDLSEVGHEMLEVNATAPAPGPLHAHSSRSVLSDPCGLRYDVTPHFSAAAAATSFCVRVAAAGDVLGDKVLKCPPFLVILWTRNRNQSNPEGGG